uniref:Ankyrin repeat and KH domain containing 1 n=1 Tax=Astyanax mexicanus TaxID=7994 RepID=A0A3B1K805_ASTMX
MADLPSSSSSSSSSSAPTGPSLPPPATEKRQGLSLPCSREEKVTVSISKPQQRAHEVISDLPSSCLPSSLKTISLPVTSPNSKMNLTSPKRGQKREDGWKEVVRRSKKLSVPASVVSRIMGRGGCNITAIQDVTGAHIDVDKQKDKNGERMITIRGGTESTRHAVQLINALIQDPAKELEDLIPRNHIRQPGTNTKIGSTYTTSTGATSTTAATSKGLPSVVPSSNVSFQSSSNSSSQQASKIGKNMPPGVRPPFVSLPPLAYTHPQLAILAAQTMHQIRHPRLPMAQFGGTFSPSPNTWGPFPVRPVSPGSANSSPKHTGSAAPRPSNSTPATAEHPAPVSTSAVAPGSTASPTNSAPSNTPTPTSVRKQLFSAEPKSGTAPAITTTASSSSAAQAASVPLSCAPTNSTTPPPLPAPIAPPSQHPPVPKPEPAAIGTPAKEKPADLTVPVSSAPCETPSPSPSSSSTAQPGTTLPVSRPAPPTCSNTLTNTSSTLPHYATPGVSPRMQPPGPYYPMAPGAPLQEPQSVYVPPGATQEPIKQHMPPPSLQISSTMNVMNGSQMHLHSGKAQLPPNFGPAALFNHFSSFFDSNQVGNNQVWGACHLPARTPPEQPYSAPAAYIGGMGPMESSMAPPDSSKAPGFRCASQRMASTSSPLSTSTVTPALIQAKPSSSSQQDRKVPPPIGTERLARIRQTGTVNHTILPSSYTPPVGQGGIWSYGVGSASEGMSAWSQPLMGGPMMHQQLQEQSAFSQHQAMERDDTGIVAPSNTFHQPMPTNFMDFPKGLPMSMYGGTILPPHPQMTEGPGGPMYNGLHTTDPSWNPILKVVPNSAENSDPQQVWPGTWAPHVGNVHLNHVN